MNLGLRLVLNMLTWAASISVIHVCLEGMDAVHRVLPHPRLIAATVALAALLWAALIYWRCIPRATGLLKRGAYLVFFLSLVVAVGMGALVAATLAELWIYGL